MYLVKTIRVSALAVVAAVAVIGALFAVGALTQASGHKNRTIDGTGNNTNNPEFGSAGVQLLRLAKAHYADRISEPSGADPKSAREISNLVADQPAPLSIPNSVGVSDFFWQWGQFLDHDIDLTPDASGELFPIPVPMGDPDFDPLNTGIQAIGLIRSSFDPTSGTSKKIRVQGNQFDLGNSGSDGVRPGGRFCF